MKTVVHKSESRGLANHGWLNSRHSFSFAGYHDPERIHFGALRVLNDDQVAAGKGFGTHPHDNMEIVSIPLYGDLAHKDSTGTEEVIKSGDVQIMSAGSGLRHSEYNHSKEEEVQFLQIWIFPKERNITPRYEQKTFSVEDRMNKFQTVVSPEHSHAVWINQDAFFSMANLDAGTRLAYDLKKPGNGVYFFVLNGDINIANEKLDTRDAVGVTDSESIEIKASSYAEILAIEVPMEF